MPSTAKKRTSGDPRKRAQSPQQEKYAPTRWGNSGGGIYVDLEVPSGQLCQVRRPGVEGLLKAGILHNLDVLSPIISKHKAKADGKPTDTDIDEDLAELAKDPQKIDEMMHLLDRVVTYVVVQPVVHMTPNDPTRRENDKIYADMVDLEDKIFILNFAVGGSRDLERFRSESEAALGSVHDQLETADSPQ